MAKSIILNKEFNKRKIFTKNFINRQVYHSFLKDSRLSLQERQHIYQKLTKIRYSSSVVRLKNYCMLTGHSRAVYRDVKLSRHKFNTMVLNGNIPGCILVHGSCNNIICEFFISSVSWFN
jgi:small subunit ribosomal protein S14